MGSMRPIRKLFIGAIVSSPNERGAVQHGDNYCLEILNLGLDSHLNSRTHRQIRVMKCGDKYQVVNLVYIYAMSYGWRVENVLRGNLDSLHDAIIEMFLYEEEGVVLNPYHIY